MIASFFSADQRGGLGNKGTLPWPHHPEDMQWFRDITMGHIVIMGRRTWEDAKMPKPLPGRKVYVVTSAPIPGVSCLTSGNPVQDILAVRDSWSNRDSNIFIIGGSRLIEETKDLHDQAYIAHRKGAYFSDVRIDLHKYLMGMRIMSSAPSEDRTLNFCTYKNIDIFRPIYETVSKHTTTNT